MRDMNEREWLAIGWVLTMPMTIITIPLKALFARRSLRWCMVDYCRYVLAQLDDPANLVRDVVVEVGKHGN